MKKIAILGCENTHAKAFLKYITENEEFSDIEVVGIYSDDLDASKALQEAFGVPVLDSYDAAVGKIDGLIVTARHGGYHYKFAKPYIESGIPFFMDKPITISEEEAVTFMKELRENNVRVSGGSSLKQDLNVAALREAHMTEQDGKTISGFVRAPFHAQNNYGGFYFYAPHMVEMVAEIFGRYPISVTAKKNGENIHVLFHYENYDCVGLFADESNVYYACRMSDKGVQSLDIPITKDWYYREFKEFYSMLCGAPQPQSYEDLIASVFTMNAIERSLLNGGKEETVKPVIL